MVEGDASVILGENRNLLPPTHVVAASTVGEQYRRAFSGALVV
jgi:hypothetical protein